MIPGWTAGGSLRRSANHQHAAPGVDVIDSSTPITGRQPHTSDDYIVMAAGGPAWASVVMAYEALGAAEHTVKQTEVAERFRGLIGRSAIARHRQAAADEGILVVDGVRTILNVARWTTLEADRKRELCWTRVPVAVLERPDVTTTTQAVLAGRLLDVTGRGFVTSHNRLAEDLGMSASTVGRALRLLEQSGLVERSANVPIERRTRRFTAPARAGARSTRSRCSIAPRSATTSDSACAAI